MLASNRSGFIPRREAIGYAIRNLPHRAAPKALKAELQKLFRVGIVCELSAVILRANGDVVDVGVVSRRAVTDTGVQFIANAFLNTTEPENMNFHGSGTGNAGELAADTTLAAEVADARASGAQTSPGNGAYRTVATQTYGGARAIVEHAVFSASTSGTMLDRSVFAVMNVGNGDQIQWTYTITFNSGG